MRVVKHRNIEQEIVLSKNIINNLVIENPVLFRSYITGIDNQIQTGDEFLLLYEDDKPKELHKCCYFMKDVINPLFDEKKSNLLVQKELSSRISYSSSEEYKQLLNKISDFISSISYDYPLNVTSDSDISLASFLKMFSVSLDQYKENFLDRLLANIKQITYLLKLDLIIFLNLHDYLTKEELIQFIKELNMMEVNYFIVSSHVPHSLLSNEKAIIIDDDLCELNIESKSEKY